MSAVGLSAVGWSTHAFAQNADDDEDVPLDTRFCGKFLKDSACRGMTSDRIEYRERAPLVVPPSRNLPPPQIGSRWSPTIRLGRRIRTSGAARSDRRRPRRPGSGARAEADGADKGRPLRPSELDQPGASAATAKTRHRSRPRGLARGRCRRPSSAAKRLFGGIMSSFAPTKAEAARSPRRTAARQPDRTAPGYQTPSPTSPTALGRQEDSLQALDPRGRRRGPEQ